MANTASQATQIRDLLTQRLEAFDPTLDVSPGSAAYSQIIGPVFLALSADPFDTDIEEFLKTRLRQELPTLSVQNGDAIVDIVIRPLQLLLESFKREIQIIRQGQSVRNPTQMRLTDAEDLAANFFVSRKAGSRASGTVRIYFATPTFVSILATAQFSGGGLNFFPTTPQFFRPEVVAAQRSGLLYYVDIAVIAEAPGESYNVAANTISTVTGLESAVRVTNLAPFSNGSDEETAAELLARTRNSLTERSLNTRRGIRARIFSDFPSIRNLEVVGFGDPEMQRDKVTGAGGGDVICSGMSLLVGRYMALISMFENRGADGMRRIRPGGTIELNFWNFLYGGQTGNQRFEVDAVLYESSSDIVGIPTIYLLKLNQAPEVNEPVGSLLPGVLPGVFAVAYDRAELRISGIPGGITNPDRDDLIVIQDDEVHIGGHYDVLVRPARSSETSVVFGASASETALYEGTSLCTVSAAELPEILSLYGAVANKVNARLRLHLVSIVGTFVENEVIHLREAGAAVLDSGGLAVQVSIASTGSFIDITGLTTDNVWSSLTSIVGYVSGATAVISRVEQVLWEDVGITRGMAVQLVNGPDIGNYKILDVRGPELVLDAEMTTIGQDFRFRVIDEVVVDAFSPRAPLFPFAGQTANDLRTIIGTATVRTNADLISFGVGINDLLEILDGGNIGEYRITGFDPVLRGRGPILESAMFSTDSNVSFRVSSGGSGLSRPLIRVSPHGMVVQTAGGQSAGYPVPPALPVGARAFDGFSGAREAYRGLNGFVFPDSGRDWAPEHTRLVVYDLDADAGAKSGTGSRSPSGTIKAADLLTISQYSGSPKACYTAGCSDPQDDIVAVVTLVADPISSSGHAIQNYLGIGLPDDVRTFLQTLRTWLVTLTEDFGLGNDFRALFDLFAPFSLDPIDASQTIVAQYEILLPRALFDGCNNVFLAAPEFDWKSALTSSVTFEDAMDLYNNGEIRSSPPALSRAKEGDILTIETGENAGAYVIERVYTFKVYHGGCLVTAGTSTRTDDYLDETAAYTYTFVKIKGEFPVNPFQGLSTFTPSTAPVLSLAGPSLNVTSSISAGPSAGDSITPWAVVQESFSWFFQMLSSAGYDVPTEISVNPGPVLQKIVLGFFDSYVVGHPTAEQRIRMYFTEPTSVTVYGTSPCLEHVWNEGNVTLARVTGASVTMAGLPALVDKDIVVFVRALDGTVTELSGTVPSEADGVAHTEAGGNALALIIQEELDPDVENIRVVHVWTASTSTSRFYIEVVSAVPGTQISVQSESASDAFYSMGFSDSVSATSVEVVGEEQRLWLAPHPPTQFSTVVGAEEVRFIATATEDPYQVVPGAARGGRTPVPSMPRDLLLHPHYDDATAFTASVSDTTYPSFMAAGVRAGEDYLRIYEQKVLLESESSGAEARPQRRDRLICVTTQAGSSVLQLPRITSGSAEFSFLSPTSQSDADVVRPGDYIFIEEGDGEGGYRITEVGDTYISVDAVMSATTALIYRSGNQGNISRGGSTFSDASAPFSPSDVGRYLTIYASNYTGVDGSFQITAVSGDRTTVTVDAEFAVSEVGMHWCVVRAPADDLASSDVDGATELLGVRPIRIYSGVASEWAAVHVHPTLERAASQVTCSYASGTLSSPFARQRNLTELGPIRGVKQPYEVVRKHVVRVSSTEMQSQVEAGLYFVDVNARSLGGTPVFNIPKDTALTPVFGTYDSDGYRFEVLDSLFTYSAAERAKIYFSSSFLPKDLNDSVENRITLNGASFSVRHEFSSEVGQIQSFLTSSQNRTLCADPLARHFLPAFVYIDLEVASGNRLKVASDIATYINSLEPQDVLDVSLIERFLHANNVGSYRHPIHLQVLTHDLDRKQVLARSMDRIGGQSGDFNGSHRTTFYIAGSPTATEPLAGQERILVKALS
jgi:hypothetical protein